MRERCPASFGFPFKIKKGLAFYPMRGCRTWTYDLQIMSLARFPTSLTRKTVSKSREINKGKTLLKEVYKHRFWFIKTSLIIKLNIRYPFLSCLLHPKGIPRPVRSNSFGGKSKAGQVWGSHEARMRQVSSLEVDTRGVLRLYIKDIKNIKYRKHYLILKRKR